MENRMIVPANNLKARVAVWSAVTGRQQRELAAELGISKSQLSQIISGRRPGTAYRDRIEELTQIA